MLAISPVASKQRHPCPWQSWIPTSGMTDIGNYYTKEFEDPRKFSDFYNIDVKRHSLCQRSSGKIVEIHSEPFFDFTKLSTWYKKEHPKKRILLKNARCSLVVAVFITNFECPLTHSKCNNVSNLSSISSAKALKVYQQKHLTKTSLLRITFNDVGWTPLKVRSYPHWIFVITIDYLTLK